MVEFIEVAKGLSFPEGPVALPDGDVLLVEIYAGRLTKVKPTGEKIIIADLEGGPNGAAIGPDGRCYICNNGGMPFLEKDNFEPGIEIRGKITILAEGCRGHLGKEVINRFELNKNKLPEFKSKITKLLSFVDPSVDSYIGFNLEILYLLSIFEQDFSNSLSLSNESKNLYQQIQEGDKISAFIKERVKKINDFQKYK